MLHRPLRPKRFRRLPGDNKLFRRRYLEELADLITESGPPPVPEIEPDESCSVSEYYAIWLREKGIDPDTGRMTLAGLAFFQELLERDRIEKKRSRPREWEA